MDELVTSQIGQVGTQFDSLGHPMIRITGKPGWKDGNYLYNGRRLEDIGGPYGMKQNGTEQVGSFFTRGLIIDLVKLKGGNLPIGYPITMDDYRAALKLAGIADAGLRPVAGVPHAEMAQDDRSNRHQAERATRSHQAEHPHDQTRRGHP